VETAYTDEANVTVDNRVVMLSDFEEEEKYLDTSAVQAQAHAYAEQDTAAEIEEQQVQVEVVGTTGESALQGTVSEDPLLREMMQQIVVKAPSVGIAALPERFSAAYTPAEQHSYMRNSALPAETAYRPNTRKGEPSERDGLFISYPLAGVEADAYRQTE
jgi:hypothetical protein